MLGGGVEPGAMTVIHGATGVGKTHFGLRFLGAGAGTDAQPGVIIDCTTRGDSQQHAEYARRLCGWELGNGAVACEDIWSPRERGPDLFNGLDYSGKPVTRANVSEDEWRVWEARLQQRLEDLNAFLYFHFVRGVRRVLIDGIEPAERVEDSVQLKLIEHTYQNVLRTDHDWVARNLFRGQWMQQKDAVAAHAYDKDDIATVILQTSHEVMLTDLMCRNVLDGDLATNANTVILLGRWPLGGKIARAAFVLKHRGRACSDEVVPFTITDDGLQAL